ncbi:MAG: phosphoserine phosphatase RsbU/P [Pyrinomonadaceae bacterium]|jgi:sigma-B regulation protein RsbU (phosphoserine phosphatase)|nr:phosphoserine phosphatase RsbU/P [Pyrinomonadaceae bacterium]
MESLKQTIEGTRAWLRRVMPHAAVLSAALFVVWLLIHNSRFYREGLVGRVFPVALLLIYFTAAYYALVGLRWLKRRVMWRVRRRLVITYLFVGLTPIVLLITLAAMVYFVGLSQVMNRIVRVQLVDKETQAHANARTLAEAFLRLPQNNGDSSNRAAQQAWLDERVTLLQPSLPGARVAVWSAGAGGRVDETKPAQFTSEPRDVRVRGVGGDETPVGAPLPAWLRARDEWRGFAYVPPASPTEAFGTPSMRAFVRARDGDREVSLLFVMPVSRVFVEQLRLNTDLQVHPFFLGADIAAINFNRGWWGSSISIGARGVRQTNRDEERQIELAEGARRIVIDFRRDQLGDEVNTSSMIVLPATSWPDGAVSQRGAFLCKFSAFAMANQLFEENELGKFFQGTFLLVAVVFLILELLALLSAAWLTRAVTGTVHKLYRATEFIKRGDFSHRVRVRSRDQLGELAEAFNDMSANIESLLQERVKHERLEREVEIAAEVQAQLFPRKVPRLLGAEIVGECRAARGVAGDYYDYVEIAPGLVAFALGDVAGKGISAALVMSNLQASLRAQATILAERMRAATRAATAATTLGGGQSSSVGVEMPCGVTGVDVSCAVEQMAASINEQLCHSTDSNRFATLFIALYDDDSRQLRYTNAGHNDALLVRASGTIEHLTEGGTVLGAFEWARYTEASATLERGDVLVIYSDGISEADNPRGAEYTEHRLAHLVRQNRDKTADEIRRLIFTEVDNWTSGQERDDDQTVVIIKSY